MRLLKLYITILSVFFIINSSFNIIASTDDVIQSKVEALFNIEMKTATDLYISVTLDVIEITVFDNKYSNKQVQILAESSNYSSIETMGAIKLQLRTMLKNQLSTTFENAKITIVNEKPIYDNEMFYDEFIVNLTYDFFDLNESVNAHDFINGILDMGAQVFYSFNFHAEPGWNNTYSIKLANNMGRPYTNGNVEVDWIRWYLKNWDGNHPITVAELQIQLLNPTTPRLEDEEILIQFNLDTRNVKPTVLNTTLLVKYIDITGYTLLPDFIDKLNVISSDGLRLFNENGILSFTEFYNKTIIEIENKIIDIIKNSSFNQTLEFDFLWDNSTTSNCSTPYDIYNMDNYPPITAFLVDDNIDLKICGITPRALFGLSNTGATVNLSINDINFGNRLDELGYKYNISLYLPENLYLDNKNIYSWNIKNPTSGNLFSNISKEYKREKINTFVEIDISSTDLNLLSFFKGITELNLGLSIQETRNYSVSIIPDEFRLPNKVKLNYLISDAFRLCIQENVFSSNEIDLFLENEKSLFENRMTNVLPDLKVKGLTKKRCFEESLKWKGNISNMNSEKPVKVVSYSHNIQPLSFSLSFFPPEFYISTQRYNFTGLKNQNITYKILFPHGTDVVFNDSLNRGVLKNTDDGRDYILISFIGSESNITDIVYCTIIPSPLFIIGVFIPCIISLLITIVLVIVVYIVRKKRKEKKIESSNNRSDEKYENEEYYIPPPPSKR